MCKQAQDTLLVERNHSIVPIPSSKTKVHSSERHPLHAIMRTVGCTGVGRESGLVLGSLLVDVGRSAVLLLVSLVANGILGSRGTVICMLEDDHDNMHWQMLLGTHRVPRLALLSLATSLLASLEPVLAALLTESAT